MFCRFREGPGTGNGDCFITHSAVIRIGPTAESPRALLAVLCTFYSCSLRILAVYRVAISLVVILTICWKSCRTRRVLTPFIGYCVRREFKRNGYFMVFIEIRKGIAIWILGYIHFRAINGYAL